MGFEIINKLKKEKGLTNAQIAELSGVTLSTLDKITSGKNTNPKLDTLQAICRVLGCRLDDFDESSPKNAPTISVEARKIAMSYDKLDNWGKKVVRDVVNGELARVDAAKAAPEAPPPAKRIIPLIGASFAAGIGEPDFGNALEDYEVDADVRADFAVRVNGDSMEPYLPDGSIQFGVRGTPRDGDVAALMVDGAFYVKQVCIDSVGNLYLFSLNRARKDADLTVWASGESTVSSFGTIIMPRRVPLPMD